MKYGCSRIMYTKLIYIIFFSLIASFQILVPLIKMAQVIIPILHTSRVVFCHTFKVRYIVLTIINYKMWTTKQTQTSNFCFMKDFPILHTQLMARIDDVGKKVQRHWKNTKFIVESTNLKSKIVWRALLELSADTHSQFSPI